MAHSGGLGSRARGASFQPCLLSKPLNQSGNRNTANLLLTLFSFQVSENTAGAMKIEVFFQNARVPVDLRVQMGIAGGRNLGALI
jgi:hypothetical protein